MTHLGNRTIRLTRGELDALPLWLTRTNEVEGAMYRTETTGPERQPVIAQLVRNPPMFDLTAAWYRTEIV